MRLAPEQSATSKEELLRQPFNRMHPSALLSHHLQYWRELASWRAIPSAFTRERFRDRLSALGVRLPATRLPATSSVAGGSGGGAPSPEFAALLSAPRLRPSSEAIATSRGGGGGGGDRGGGVEVPSLVHLFF